MDKPHNIHDNHFRTSMGRKDVAQDFLDNYLPPAVLNHLDLSTLSICKDTFVSADNSAYYSDLLYRVNSRSNSDTFIYLLFEHKSNPDRFTALQLLRYMVEIWQQYQHQHPRCKTLPLILPMVVYHGKPRQEGITLGELVETPDEAMKVYVPDFAFKFFDFSPDSYLELKGTALTKLFLLSLKAKNEPKKVEILRAMMEIIAQLDDSPESLEFMNLILFYAQLVMDIDKEVVIELTNIYLSGKKEKAIMTIAEQWRQEGEQRGIMKGRMEGRMEGEELGLMKGRSEGRTEGQATILSHQIASKFGDQVFKKNVQDHLQNATPEQLTLWAERILFAQSIDEVFATK